MKNKYTPSRDMILCIRIKGSDFKYLSRSCRANPNPNRVLEQDLKIIGNVSYNRVPILILIVGSESAVISESCSKGVDFNMGGVYFETNINHFPLIIPII